MHEWAQRAVSAAKGLEDAPLIAAALAMPALADAVTGGGENAPSQRAAAALVDSLSDDELARRNDAAVWLAAAELNLDRYVEADAHAIRLRPSALRPTVEGAFRGRHVPSCAPSWRSRLYAALISARWVKA
jgi:hypothetical protein